MNKDQQLTDEFVKSLLDEVRGKEYEPEDLDDTELFIYDQI